MKKQTIEEACTLHARIGWQGLTKAEYLDDGDYYLVTGVDFLDGVIDFEHCHYVSQDRYDQDEHIQLAVDDVLVTKDGTIGKVAIIDKLDKPATLNSGVFVVRPKNKENLLPEYLIYALRSSHFSRFIDQIKVGCTIAHLNQAKFLKYEIPVISIGEQEHVIYVLKRAESIVKARQQELQKLDALIKARFVELFGNPLDKTKANKYFVECVEFNPKKTEVKDSMETKVSFVPMECVGVDGSFTIREDGLVKDYYKGYTYFRDGDVLLAKITPCFENGKVSIAENCTNGIGFGTTEFHVSRPIEGVSNSYWIKYMLKNDLVHDLATINMTGSAGQKRIQTPFFEKLKIYLPPIEQQEQFAEFVKQVDKSKVVVQKSLEDTQMLFDSLMQKYFG